jgi:hypothetical protein
MWYILIIPIIATLGTYYFWPRKITIGEIIIPVALSALTILISQAIMKNKNMEDVEYNGYLIVKAEYYEYWETWVTRECSYTTTNCDSKGENCTTTTHYYDCSYCDENSKHYVAYLSNGSTIGITQQYYEYLIKRWSATPTFVELNRDIDRRRSCGKDGDMYYIEWDGKVETSEAYVKEVSFTNRLKINHSAFDYPYMSDKEADSLGLYRYPKFYYDGFKQRAILSKDINFSDRVHTKFEYLNGMYGPKHKVKMFTLIFKNKSQDIAFKQEQYWQGGNQNELVTCIGVNDKLEIEWVKCFSWCDNKRIIVDTREDIAELKILNMDGIYDVYYRNVPLYFKYKSFKDFSYLKFEPRKAQIIWVIVLVLIVTSSTIVICVRNEINPDTFKY